MPGLPVAAFTVYNNTEVTIRMKKYILALDEGTTSVRAILFDKQARIISISQKDFPQIFPQPGWVEHDAVEIYADQYSVMTECIAKSGISPEEIAGIGITNQRETTVVWNKKTGQPVYNAIVWQCRRTAPLCSRMIADGMEEYVARTTGLKIDAYFSAAKISWILDNVPGCRSMAENGELLFGTIDAWLLWKLTKGKLHITDRTNASRTMLYSLEKGDWDDELINYWRIPRSMLPEIRSSSEIYGEINVMGERIPVSGMAGDQQAALFGQGCFSAGDAKTTYGTGCFLLEHTGKIPVRSRSGLLTTAAAVEKGREPEYALEGSVFVGGAVIQWLRDGMGFIREARDSEYFARKIEDTGGVYMVPAFTGLGAPYWDMDARGIITGLTRGTKPEHIIRAALESVAFQTDDLLKAMASDSGNQINTLRVDGGAASNDFLMQFQSDISQLRVFRPVSGEATALGAAFLAGLAVGFFRNRDELRELCMAGSSFEAEMSQEMSQKLLDGWHKAVGASRYIGD